MLATNAGLLTPILGDPSPWTPQRLYLNNEAGLYYEPADLTAEKVAWRRNLLTWSEDFTVAAGWTPVNASVSGNAATGPDGTLTADKLVESAATGAHSILQIFSTRSGTPYAAWVIAKQDTRSWLRVVDNGGSGAASYFDLATGTVGTSASCTPSIESLGGGWYLCRIVLTPAVGQTGINLQFRMSVNGTTDSYAGDGTSGLFVWRAMANIASVDPTYQRITDFTSDFLAAFPTHTLYQDAAGTTPVTALGQPVGLVLDKSRGALANLGPSRIANGAVGLTGTATPATYSTTTGVGTAVRVDPSNQSFVQFSGLTANALCLITVQNTGANSLTVRTGVDSGAIFATVAAGATTRMIGQASAGGQIAIVPSTGTIAFTVLGFNEVPGVHAIQPTSASRPALDARVNLLLATEQFELAGWSKENVTVNANATLAPDGTSTAEEMVNTATTALHRVERASITPVVGVAYRLTWRVKKNTVRYVSIGWWRAASLAAGAGFDLDTGTVTGTGAIGANYSASAADITALGNGWFELGVTVTGEAATQFPSVHHRDTAYAGGAGTFFGETYTGTTADKTFIWGADLRLAIDAAYPYQRVTTATDYADVGVPRSFLFDGFDDSLYTASTLDLSGTDKVTVWAGVYKNSDAAAGVVAELTASISLNNGSFLMDAPDDTGANGDFAFYSKGTTLRGADSAATLAPVSRVMTGIGDISGDVATLRLNGVQAATNTGDQGTGNYANAVLFIGRRNNASLPLNGKLYIPVVRGAQTDAATLALTERYVGSRMGIVL